MENRFFTWIWRFNGLAIAAIAIFVAGAIIWNITSALWGNVFAQSATNTMALPAVNTAAETEPPPETNRSFGTVFGQTERAMYALPLYVEQDYSNRGISKSSSGNLVNYKIIETDTQTSRWLFPGDDRIILSTAPLAFRESGIGDFVQGYLLEVIDEDTNSDRRLSSNDTRTLFFTDSNWSLPVKVTERVIDLLHSQSVSENQIDLIFETLDGMHATRIKLPEGTILSEQVFRTRD